ncbi:MAG: hypothetical protein ACP5NP_07955 [Acetobacteraceae bacterium]
MSAPLLIPNPERIAATNAWAFLRALTPLIRPPPASAPTGWAGLAAAVAAAPMAARARFDSCAGPGPIARADLLLWADFRPADTVLIAGVPPEPWAAARANIARFEITTKDPLAAAAATAASVLILPAAALETLATPRPQRADLPALRSLILTGGPASPAARARALAWIKADLLLLARAGNRFWGSPLDPVLDVPPPISPLFPPLR